MLLSRLLWCVSGLESVRVSPAPDNITLENMQGYSVVCDENGLRVGDPTKLRDPA